MCDACRKAAYRKANRVRAAYQALKDNAKRRGKVFDLTLHQFSQFAVETDYINKRGRSNTSYHIDRIDNDKGYTIDNIQVLTGLDNRVKAMQYNWQHPDQTRYVSMQPVQQTDNIF